MVCFVSDMLKAPYFGGVRVAHLFSFLCCVFILSVFVLCPVWPMLPVSLDCPFFVVLLVFSNVYLFSLNMVFYEIL